MIPSCDNGSEGVLPGFLTGIASHMIGIPMLSFIGLVMDRTEIAGLEFESSMRGNLPVVFAGVAQCAYMLPVYLAALGRGARRGFLGGLELSMALLLLSNLLYFTVKLLAPMV
ncbi:MAG: hypothetical protein P1V35_02140 [Planctomycetota bacterium]|nr:hypothetical protein [Planctomycetota bacterium]